ncbi:MAG: DUF5671 domain-containing protein [Thermomicrobiales bacterium]
MQTIRRLHIYLMMAVTLGLSAFGLMTLLEVGSISSGQAFGGRELLGIDADEVRQRLSLALPFVLIAGPIWWLHWKLASRSVRTSTSRTTNGNPGAGSLLRRRCSCRPVCHGVDPHLPWPLDRRMDGRSADSA